ncbi:IS1 family transposase [Shigella flexneri]
MLQWLLFLWLSLLFATDGVVRNGKSTAGHQRYLYFTAVKHGNCSSLTPLLNAVLTENH